MTNDQSRTPGRILVAGVAVLLCLLFLYSVRELLLLLFLSVLFATYLSAVTGWFRRRAGIPRPLGIVASLAVTFLGFWGIGELLVPRLVRQGGELLTALPAQLVRWEQSLTGFLEQYPLLRDMVGSVGEGQSYVGTLFREVGQYFTEVFPYLFSGLWFLVHVASFFAISIYLTAKPSLYRNEVVQLFPPAHRDMAADVLKELGVTLRAWLVGQLLAMLVLGALTWAGLALLDVPFSLAFGAFSGLAAIVPFFGTLLSTLLPAVYVLPSGGFLYALAVAGVGAVVHLVEANLVAPKIFEQRVELPPAWTLLTLLVTLKLLGPVGLVVAVPIFAVARVLIRRIYVDRVLEGEGYDVPGEEAPLAVRVPAGEGLRFEPDSEESVPGTLERPEG